MRKSRKSLGGRSLTAGIEDDSGGQEHPHAFIHILNPGKEFPTDNSFLLSPQPDDAPCPFLATLDRVSTHTKLVRLTVDVMLVEAVVAKDAKGFGNTFVAERQAFRKILAGCLCSTLTEAFKGQRACATGERLWSDKSVFGWGSAGGTILVFGLIVLTSPLLEARWAEEMVAVGVLGVDGRDFHANVAWLRVFTDAGRNTFHHSRGLLR